MEQQQQYFNDNLVRPRLVSYLVTGFSALVVILGLINLLLHASFRSLRRKTGSTIFSLIISEMLCTICILISAVSFQDFK